MTRHNNILLFILFVLFFACKAHATEYKILYLNTKTIKIGGKKCRVGDVFDDKQTIVWTTTEQCMRAKNLVSKKQRLFTASESKDSGTKSIFEFLSNLYDMYIKNNHASTRSMETVPIDQLREYLDDTFYLDGEIVVPTDLPTDSESYFRMSSNELPGKYFQLPSTEGAFTIDGSSIQNLLAHPLDSEITITIEYIKNGEVLPVSDSMLIVPFDAGRRK